MRILTKILSARPLLAIEVRAFAWAVSLSLAWASPDAGRAERRAARGTSSTPAREARRAGAAVGDEAAPPPPRSLSLSLRWVARRAGACGPPAAAEYATAIGATRRAKLRAALGALGLARRRGGGGGGGALGGGAAAWLVWYEDGSRGSRG